MDTSLTELSLSESRDISGGAIWGAIGGGIIGAAIWHTIKEVANDWGSHAEAFRDGMEAAK